MKDIIKLLLKINASEEGLWTGDYYIYTNGTKHKRQVTVQKAIDQGLVEEYGNYFILTDEGQEIVDYTQRPFNRLVKDLNNMNARFLADIQGCENFNMNSRARKLEAKKKTVEYILGPICYHARDNFSDNN